MDDDLPEAGDEARTAETGGRAAYPVSAGKPPVAAGLRDGTSALIWPLRPTDAAGYDSGSATCRLSHRAAASSPPCLS